MSRVDTSFHPHAHGGAATADGATLAPGARASVVVGILLAGGQGRRYAAESGGADKLMARLPDGVSVGVTAARVLLSRLSAVLAVVPPGAEPRARALRDAGCHVLVAAETERGMGASLAAAARYLSSGASPWRVGHGVVVALADMPWMKPDIVLAVANALPSHRIVAPVYQGRRGHPVGFTADLLPELGRLEGDAGARVLIERHGVHALTCDDSGVLRDVDRPRDLGRLE